jgi:hypothetical protein
MAFFPNYHFQYPHILIGNFMETLSGLRGKRREFRYCSIFFWFLISLSEKFQRYIKVLNLMERMPCHPFGFLKPRNICQPPKCYFSVLLFLRDKRGRGSYQRQSLTPTRYHKEIAHQVNSRVPISFRPSIASPSMILSKYASPTIS